MKTKLSLVFLLLVVMRAGAMENEVWISSIGPVNAAASGAQSAPFRCPDARSLSQLFKTKLARAGLTIHLSAGTFTVQNPGLLVWPGWKLRGAGVDNTIVQLITNAAPGVAATVFYADSADGAEISDLTIDCNYQNQTTPKIVTAVSLTGSNVRISRVKAINWGTASAECFVIDIGNDGSPHVNPVIEDCVVTQPAPVIFGGGASAISIFTGENIRGAILRNNLVYDVCSGTGGIGCPQYFHAYMDSACTGGATMNNVAYDLTGPASVGIYRDTWNGQNAVLSGNVFNNVTVCINYNLTAYHMISVSILNNVLRPGEGGTGILYYAGEADGDTNAFASQLIVNANIIYPAAGVTNAHALVLVTRRPNTVMNNVLQGAGEYVDCRIPAPDRAGTNSFVGNVNVSGAMITR